MNDYKFFHNIFDVFLVALAYIYSTIKTLSIYISVLPSYCMIYLFSGSRKCLLYVPLIKYAFNSTSASGRMKINEITISFI